MTLTKIKKGLVLVTIALAVGCELIVDFDRTKIPVEVTEASIPDSAVSETSTPPAEGGSDATPDATDGEADADGASDAATDG